MILGFHNISTYSYPLPAKNDISVDKFKEIIIEFLNKSYHFYSADEYFKVNDGKKILLTFDDGYYDQYLIVKEFLKLLKIPAIFFISTSMIGKNWESVNGIKIRGIKEEELKKLFSWGYQIGSHGHLHKLWQGKEELFEEDIKKSFLILEDILGGFSPYFSFPFGFANSFLESKVKVLKLKKSFFLGKKKIEKKHFFCNRIPVNKNDNFFSVKFKSLIYNY